MSVDNLDTAFFKRNCKHDGEWEPMDPLLFPPFSSAYHFRCKRCGYMSANAPLPDLSGMTDLSAMKNWKADPK